MLWEPRWAVIGAPGGWKQVATSTENAIKWSACPKGSLGQVVSFVMKCLGVWL